MRLCASALLAACGPAADTAAAPQRGPNVLIVVLDDVGLDKIAAYGLHPSPAHTPNIDALAAAGVRFRRAYANPVCSMSRAALLTGRHGSRTGVGRWGHPSTVAEGLPLHEVTLPELLTHSETGHTSAAFGKWHLASYQQPDPGRDPLAQGFSAHVGPLGNPRHTVQEADPETLGYTLWERNTSGALAWSTDYLTSDTTTAALRWMSQHRPPWLLWVAYSAPHYPFHAPPAPLLSAPVDDSDDDVTLHDAMLEALDTELGRLLGGIPDDVRAQTTVILLGDNGTAEAAVVAPWDPARSKGTLYEGGVGVPLIVTGPAVAVPGAQSDALVHIVDVFPTVAELLGADASALARDDGAPIQLDGLSLVPHLQDPGLPSSRSLLYTEQLSPSGPPPYDEHARMLRDEDWKYLRDSAGQESLFKLDPSAHDEGADLLASGASLDADAAAALARLRAAMDDAAAQLTYGP